jgi:NTE family protein
MKRKPDDLALVMTGGGARAAYQVGLLKHLARRFPELKIPILTGVSAGAINSAYLATHPGSLREKVDDLARLWGGLSVDKVFRVDSFSLIGHLIRWAFQLVFTGGIRGAPKMRGFVDTAPLHKLLEEALGAEHGKLTGIQANLKREALRALALVTTNYATGQTISWCQGDKIEPWERPMRRSIATTLSVSHVMASSALPMFFPAVSIGNDYFGDGGVRHSAPLAPAVHLGAARILAISTRHAKNQQDVDLRSTSGYPPPAQVLGVLLNAIFLDALDQDAVQLERVNRLVASQPPATEPQAQQAALRHVDLMVLRPSRDLGVLANEYEARLPGLFRFLTRRLGTRETKSPDILSLVMFQGEYLTRLIELGEADAEEQAEEIAAFLSA